MIQEAELRRVIAPFVGQPANLEVCRMMQQVIQGVVDRDIPPKMKLKVRVTGVSDPETIPGRVRISLRLTLENEYELSEGPDKQGDGDSAS